MTMVKGTFKEDAGRHIGIVDGQAKELEPGDEVELTENQAKKFADKFDLPKAKPAAKEAGAKAKK